MSNQMDQKAFKRIQSTDAKKHNGQVERGSSVAKLQSEIDKKSNQGNKK